MITQATTYQVELNGFKELIAKLQGATREETLKKGLSQGTLFLARWSSENRIANLNSNLKQILPDKLTARTVGGYKYRIFGQTPSAIEKNGNEYRARFGTNIVSKRGFSYPRLHEFGGKFHPPRPVLTPAIQNPDNRQRVLDFMTKVVNEALEKK